MPHRNLRCQIKKANLRAITKEDCLNHLSATEMDKLLKLLQEFEEQFDGTLGDWDCNLVSLQLKDQHNHIMTDHSQYQKACGSLKKGNPKTMQLGSFEVASRLQMDFVNLHHTKERQHHKGG